VVKQLTSVQFNQLSLKPEIYYEEIGRLINNVARSGIYLNGNETFQFESDLAGSLGVQHVTGVASGTDALRLAMQALGVNAGDRVLTTANSGGYATTAARLIGAEVDYCDVYLENGLMDLESLEKSINKDTKVVVATHLYGNILPMPQIVEICDRYNVPIIEDCAQSMGGTYSDQAAGTFGKVGCFSFYPTKNLGAFGDAGAIATNDPMINQKIRKLKQYGWESKYFSTVEFGSNSRIDEIQAAVLRVGLKFLPNWNQTRRQICADYAEAIEGTSLRMLTKFNLGNVCHLAVFVAKSEKERDDYREKFKEFNVQTEVHYPFLDCEQTGFGTPNSLATLPNSMMLSRRIFSLPCYPELTNSDFSRVISVLKDLS
jgi:dTDP-4-amino-4,6-dideoxygalactose transaminase